MTCKPSQINPLALPKCEKYFREQGYDFKFSNGRLVLVRKTKRQARRRRQLEVGLQYLCLHYVQTVSLRVS